MRRDWFSKNIDSECYAEKKKRRSTKKMASTIHSILRKKDPQKKGKKGRFPLEWITKPFATGRIHRQSFTLRRISNRRRETRVALEL